MFDHFGPSEAEISADWGVSGGPAEISDTFFETPMMGLHPPQMMFDNIQKLKSYPRS